MSDPSPRGLSINQNKDQYSEKNRSLLITRTVVENRGIFSSTGFVIKNAEGKTLFRIERIKASWCSCDNDDFIIENKDGDKVGKISKQWSGLVRELFTDSDYFGVSFPMELDVRMKAVMVGACFLIDAMFYETRVNKSLLAKMLMFPCSWRP